MSAAPGLRIVTAPRWWKASLGLTQDLFAGAELIQIRNGFWKQGEPEHLEFYQKYEALLTDGRRIVLPNRVSDIAGVKWDISALMDWQALEVAHRLVGVPVMTYTDANGETVTIRGKWKSIDAAIKQLGRNGAYRLTLDQSNALIPEFEDFHHLKLMEFHKKAFSDRSATRDEAAEFGTRAHELIDKWLKFPGLQTLDAKGLPLMDEVHFLDRQERHVYIDLSKEHPKVQQACRAFYQFWLAETPRLIASEMFVADLANGVAGMIDNVSETPDGCRVIYDYKTGNFIGQSMCLQTTGYGCMFELVTGKPIDRVYIIQLDKETAEFKVVPVYVNEEERERQVEAWHHALALYHWQKDEGKALAKLR